MELLRHFSELRLAIEPGAAQLAARNADPAGKALITEGYDRMVAAERGDDDALDADIAFHVAILRASANPFFEQFEEVVSTALRSSIRFTNRVKGHSASLPAHHAVLVAINAGAPEEAHIAMHAIIRDVMTLIEETEAKRA